MFCSCVYNVNSPHHYNWSSSHCSYPMSLPWTTCYWLPSVWPHTAAWHCSSILQWLGFATTHGSQKTVGHEMMNGSLSWQLHLVRTYLADVLTRCSGPPQGGSWERESSCPQKQLPTQGHWWFALLRWLSSVKQCNDQLYLQWPVHSLARSHTNHRYSSRDGGMCLC